VPIPLPDSIVPPPFTIPRRDAAETAQRNNFLCPTVRRRHEISGHHAKKMLLIFIRLSTITSTETHSPMAERYESRLSSEKNTH
jgi:hypothetical protein